MMCSFLTGSKNQELFLQFQRFLFETHLPKNTSRSFWGGGQIPGPDLALPVSRRPAVLKYAVDPAFLVQTLPGAAGHGRAMLGNYLVDAGLQGGVLNKADFIGGQLPNLFALVQ